MKKIGVRKCSPRFIKAGVIFSEPELYSNTFYIDIKYSECTHQSFGGISLNDVNKCLKDICEALGVKTTKDLVGLKVECIFNTLTIISSIKGIRLAGSDEAFIWDAWREDMGHPRYDTISYESKKIKDEIERFNARIKAKKLELRNLKKDFDEIY